jgi:hypothetical protein
MTMTMPSSAYPMTMTMPSSAYPMTMLPALRLHAHELSTNSKQLVAT